MQFAVSKPEAEQPEGFKRVLYHCRSDIDSSNTLLYRFNDLPTFEAIITNRTRPQTVMANSTQETSTSSSLLAKAKQSDATCWQRIVQLYGPLIYTWARRAGVSAPDAADIMQEVLSKVSQKLGSYDPERTGASFRGWLWTITKHKIIDSGRRQFLLVAKGGSSNLQQVLNLQQPTVAVPEEFDPEDSIPQDSLDRAETIARAMQIMRSHFEPTTWQAFWRSAIDGISPAEVAEELGISRWNVYKARARVLNRLRQDLDGLEELP